MFAADFPSVRTWQLFTQWHHDGCCGSPPVEFFVHGEEMRLRLTDSVTVWTAPLVRGVWHEFIFHVKWSADPSVGFVELWHNREQVLPKRNLATMYAGMNNYLKLGLYRNDTIAQVGVVYHDGFIQATRLEDVLPPPPPPPPRAGRGHAGCGHAPLDAWHFGARQPRPGQGVPPPGGSRVTTRGQGIRAREGHRGGGLAPWVLLGGEPAGGLALVSLLGGLRVRRRR